MVWQGVVALALILNCASAQDPCASAPCQNGGTCHSEQQVLPGLYFCQCIPGYSGKSCEIDIDECASNPCTHGGTCINEINGFSCACTTLYTGARCMQIKGLEERLALHGGYTQILSLLKSSGLLATLENAKELTLFAPTDDALARVPADQLAALTSDADALKRLLGYHAVLEDVEELHNRNIRDLHDQVFMSSNNLPVRTNIYFRLHSIAVEGVNLTERAIKISNGFVHGIDGIMIPPEGNVVDIIAKDPELSTLNSMLSAAGVVEIIRKDMNITMFAPTNDAFAKLDPNIPTYLIAHPGQLKDVLLYHVIKYQTLYSIGMYHTLTFPTADKRHDSIMVLEDFATGALSVNSANIVKKDISATNGVIHLIDEVLIPAVILVKIEDAGAAMIG